ncbi:PTS IIA-like nitrogen-regulatory protein PtsN [hydrothermal vent metagenome]|uniref:PTS IIA-like nitrogen-regulatory protein PtsN n=1 Tax=hydrothermal vent metagenome TaxID=652676 RepID=A0A3B0W0S6_9ZZZZ
MMVSDVLAKEFIMPELVSTEKRELLDEMSGNISELVGGLDREELLEVLLEREKLGSTGIGHGVAIPHAKIKGIERVIVSMGISGSGVDFQSMDDKPVHIFFLIIAPEQSSAAHLKVLSGISRLLKDAAFRNKLMKAESRGDIYNTIVEEDKRLQRNSVL